MPPLAQDTASDAQKIFYHVTIRRKKLYTQHRLHYFLSQTAYPGAMTDTQSSYSQEEKSKIQFLSHFYAAKFSRIVREAKQAEKFMNGGGGYLSPKFEQSPFQVYSGSIIVREEVQALKKKILELAIKGSYFPRQIPKPFMSNKIYDEERKASRLVIFKPYKFNLAYLSIPKSMAQQFMELQRFRLHLRKNWHGFKIDSGIIEHLLIFQFSQFLRIQCQFSYDYIDKECEACSAVLELLDQEGGIVREMEVFIDIRATIAPLEAQKRQIFQEVKKSVLIMKGLDLRVFKKGYNLQFEIPLDKRRVVKELMTWELEDQIGWCHLWSDEVILVKQAKREEHKIHLELCSPMPSVHIEQYFAKIKEFLIQ